MRRGGDQVSKGPHGPTTAWGETLAARRDQTFATSRGMLEVNFFFSGILEVKLISVLGPKFVGSL
jgi:hypothetical protein